MKIITISDKHSNYKGKKLVIELEGGSPYFCYLWIDDKMYTLTKRKKSVKIKRTEFANDV